MIRIHCIALAVLLATSPGAFAKEPVKAPSKATAKAPAPAAPVALAAPQLVRTVEGIQEYRLANGLQVLLFADPASTTTLVNLVYRVGSRHEGAGEAGMAHLLEHLLFKGTPSFSDIPKLMSERGVRFNATTSTDRTNYFAGFNANPETLAFVLQLEAERMQQSRVETSDLAKEMPVVMNELQQGENNPMQLLRQRLNATAYRFHPYGKPTIGTQSDVENVPIESLRRFYKAHYRPDNATLIVAGQFDEAAVLAQLQQRFAGLQNPSSPKPQAYTVEPPQDGERSVVVRRVGGSAVTLLGYHAPPFAHPDCAALTVLGQMLTQRPSGPLYQRFVETDKLAAQVGAGGCGGHDAGLFNVIAIHQAGVTPERLELPLLEALEQRKGVTLSQEQFDRIQSQFALSYSQLLKQPQQMAQLLTEAVAAADWRLVFKLVADVKALKLEDVQRVAETYLKANNRTLARYEPVAQSGAVEIPKVADRQAGLDQLATAAVSAGERIDPSPMVLQSRSQFSTLPRSGIRLALLPKKSRGEQVQGEIELRWGELPALVQANAANFVASQLTEGNARLSRQQIVDESVRLKGSFNINGGKQGLTLSLTGERASFLELMKLAFQVLKEPTFPAEPFERAQKNAQRSLNDSRAEPSTLRGEAVRTHYNQQRSVAPGHPDYIQSLDDRLNGVLGVTRDQVAAFHKDFWSANEGDAAFVGALPDGFAEALDAELAAWKKPNAPRFVRWKSPFKPVAPFTVHTEAKDKAAAVLQLRQELQLSSESPETVALNMANHLLGGGSLESRLNVRLRQQGGLTYGIGSGLQIDDWDDSASWSIGTSMAPENREKVLAAIREVLAQVLKEGFSAAEVERARKDLIESRIQRRASDAGLVDRLGWLVERQLDWRHTEAWDERYRKVTLDEVNAALRKYLKPDAWVISSAGDYAKKPPVAP